MEINTVLRNHQLESSEVLALLHQYMPRIIKRFYGDDLPLPALSVDYAPKESGLVPRRRRPRLAPSDQH